MTAAAPAIPQSGETPQTWDSAELPAPVPEGLPTPEFPHIPAPGKTTVMRGAMPLLGSAAPASAPGPSANQLILHIRAGLEQLEWCVPTHDLPWNPAPTTHALMATHAAQITRALDALLSIPTAAPAPIDAAAQEETDNVEA